MAAENQTALLDAELDDEDLIENDPTPERFYDDGENYYRLREERGDMPTPDHNHLVDYLLQLLSWLYHTNLYTVEREINFYETDEYAEKPLYPDIFVRKGEVRPHFTSYQLEVEGPAPELIIEIISKRTRPVDLKQKPQRYADWGVAEYFAYDPRDFKYKGKRRLWGWRLVGPNQYEEIQPDKKTGRMWSEQLDSWLVPDGHFVRLYDRDGNLRLTKLEEQDLQLQQLNRQLETERMARVAERREKDLEIERLRERLRQLEDRSDS